MKHTLKRCGIAAVLVSLAMIITGCGTDSPQTAAPDTSEQTVSQSVPETSSDETQTETETEAVTAETAATTSAEETEAPAESTDETSEETSEAATEAVTQPPETAETTTTTAATTTAAATTTTTAAVTTTAATTTTAAATTTTAASSESEESAVSTSEPVEKKIVALTFDDGPNTGVTNEILDILEEYGIKASFFVIGQNITSQSGPVMKRAHSLGCEINSHSFTHSYMNEMSAEDIVDEMERTAQLIYDYVGEYPHFFRPPYIAVNSTMYENIDIPFISGIGCNDWDAKVPVEKRVRFLTEKCPDGCIILLHDAAGNEQTVEALRQAIPVMLENGFEFVTTTELFAAKGITPSADTEVIYSYATVTGWQ